MYPGMHIKPCGRKDCVVTVARLLPQTDLKIDIKSTIELDLFINKSKHNINATGSYSDLEVALMWGFTTTKSLRSHFGLILKQENSWVIDKQSRKCLLFHHMGTTIGVQIAVGCEACVRSRVRNVYGSEVPQPRITFHDYGRSSAAVGRFMGDTALGRNVKYQYNSKYARGEQFYDWQTTNCLRLVFDLLFYLVLNKQLAEEFTIRTTGDGRWAELFLTLLTEYPAFENSMENMWKEINRYDELTKVAALLDKQYHLSSALKLKESCVCL